MLVLVAALALLLLPAVALVSMAMGELPEALRGVQQSQAFADLASLRIGNVEVGEHLAQAGGQMVSWASTGALAFFGSASRGLLNLTISFFGVYYLLLTPDVLWGHIRPHLPLSARSADALRERFDRVTRATVWGIVVTGFAHGEVIGGGFALFGLPSPVFWGAATALASVVPVVGSTLI